MRLEGKVAIVVGAGQTPGETIGNGRATAILFAREGARVLLVDRDLDSARETERMIADEGGAATSFAADIVQEDACRRIPEACLEHFDRIDILHNNVGIGSGDASVMRVSESAWNEIFDVNVKGPFLTTKHVLPVMREQGSGSIIFVSSVAAVASTPLAAYKSSKAALNALTLSVANGNAKYGIRANAIMPGLMDTPMAIEGISAARGIDPGALRRDRDRRVPLRGKMGTAWDVAYAALYLASDEAHFVTGVILPVDGGQAARVG